MEFEPLELKHIDLIRPFFRFDASRLCDFTAGGTMMWRGMFGTQFCVDDGILYLKMNTKYGTAYSCPLGNENGAAYEKLISHCRVHGEKIRLCPVPLEQVKSISSLIKDANVVTDRQWCDYLYTASDLIEFPGRRYSAQRNHINRFKRENPEWSFSEMREEEVPNILEFLRRCIGDEESRKTSGTLVEGDARTLEIVSNSSQYGLSIGVLKAGDAIVGLSVGELTGDTLYIHAEKADTGYQGVYQMLVREFASKFGSKAAYINREEDDGDEGLRRSKLSYQPIKLLEKYLITE